VPPVVAAAAASPADETAPQSDDAAPAPLPLAMVPLPRPRPVAATMAQDLSGRLKQTGHN
jgi:hypothetical protein